MVESCCLPNLTFTDADWIENMRLSKITFFYLCDSLRPFLEQQNKWLCRAIFVEHHVAVTLWTLVMCSEYRSIRHPFRVARSTLCVIVHDTYKEIVDALLDIYIYIKFSLGNELCDVVEGFKSRWGMIQYAGSIHESHIPVSLPALNHTDYYNRKGWDSISVQAVVDHKYMFCDVCVGWPGRVHDTQVVANSALFNKANQRIVMAGNEIRIGIQTYQYSFSVIVRIHSSWLISSWHDGGAAWGDDGR